MIVIEAASSGDELFFGIVAPSGTDTSSVADSLSQSLSAVQYDLIVVKLSELIATATDIDTSALLEDERIETLQQAGNDLCARELAGDAVVRLAVAKVDQIRRSRNEESGTDLNGPLEGVAFLFSSLKRIAEVRALRQIYGPWFVLLGVEAPISQREGYLAAKIKTSRPSFEQSQCRERARTLIEKDRHEVGEPWGQNVLQTFPYSDAFISAKDPGVLGASLDRVIGLFFGEPAITPNVTEWAMSAAHTAAMRSGSTSRRVGAAIVLHGDLIAVGVNQFPAFGGGQLFPTTSPDARDVTAALDTNKDEIRSIAADLLKRLAAAGKLSTECATEIEAGRIDWLTREIVENDLAGSKLTQVIEYQAPVHAEVSAILSASRQGTSVVGADLYVTTYPCHLCMREILTAGIHSIVYLEPYPKSHAQAMYVDLIETEVPRPDRLPITPYIGIAPWSYPNWFSHPNREAERPTLRPLPTAVLGSPLSTLHEREQSYIADTTILDTPTPATGEL